MTGAGIGDGDALVADWSLEPPRRSSMQSTATMAAARFSSPGPT